MKIFQEQQRYRGTEAYVLVGIFLVLALSLMIKILFFSAQFSTSAFIFDAVVLTISIGSLILLNRVRTEISVGENKIKYLQRPFQKKRRKIKWKNIDKVIIESGNSEKAYCGWRVAYALLGQQLPMGQQGKVTLIMKNGEKCTLSVKDPEKFEDILERIPNLHMGTR